jgi:hypothetical protein
MRPPAGAAFRGRSAAAAQDVFNGVELRDALEGFAGGRRRRGLALYLRELLRQMRLAENECIGQPRPHVSR